MAAKAWSVRGSSRPLESRWISIRADDCVTATGAGISPFYVIESPDFVHVLALEQEGRVVLVRQYRHGYGGMSLELPGGLIDPGEKNIVAVAARELLEETGYGGGHLSHLATLSIDPSRYANRQHLVCARGVVLGQANPEPTEDIDVVVVSREEAQDLAVSGAIINAAHIGLLMMGLSMTG
ncbi:NUDIX hydrolase [Methylobacterium nodulans]|uniref:NUDIX hydrolase n=1 Tax=Methylobacterium nodulans (strain LMG 21967 / CNCM I-2342 / ORS 2060) TaxID=460265 RepID=B8IIH7_METNO|nr:NUDIX hydrolase [Methylobacterium nodulans]ACL59854.1 NUDIX hydrolase [Methylobacterium nodulans ORS 2060]